MALLGAMSEFTDQERMAAMRLFRTLERRNIAPIGLFALGPDGSAFALFNGRFNPEQCNQIGTLVDGALALIGAQLQGKAKAWPS
jgi:hypothetical protein